MCQSTILLSHLVNDYNFRNMDYTANQVIPTNYVENYVGFNNEVFIT